MKEKGIVSAEGSCPMRTTQAQLGWRTSWGFTSRGFRAHRTTRTAGSRHTCEAGGPTWSQNDSQTKPQITPTHIIA